MSSPILNFLVEYGISLEHCGSAEVGLRPPDALRFLDLLFAHDIPVLGIEEWRHTDGRYAIASLGGWYTHGQDLQAHLSAKRFIETSGMRGEDALTVQFEGMADSYGAFRGRVGV